MPRSNNDSDPDNAYYFSIGVVIIILLLIIYWMMMLGAFDTWSNRNAFGGMFATINTLFTGIALVGLWLNIRNQDRNLKLQQQALSDTQEHFINNREIDLFFKLKEDLHLIRERVKDGGVTSGVNAFEKLLEEFHDAFKADRMYNVESRDKTHNKVVDTFKELSSAYELEYSGYTFHVDHINKFIANCSLQNQSFFRDTLKHTLSVGELIALKFHYLIKLGDSSYHNSNDYLIKDDTIESLTLKILGIDLENAGE